MPQNRFIGGPSLICEIGLPDLISQKSKEGRIFLKAILDEIFLISGFLCFNHLNNLPILGIIFCD
jgi:hypothetical protein